jgi:hypothetical protein
MQNYYLQENVESLTKRCSKLEREYKQVALTLVVLLEHLENPEDNQKEILNFLKKKVKSFLDLGNS